MRVEWEGLEVVLKLEVVLVREVGLRKMVREGGGVVWCLGVVGLYGVVVGWEGAVVSTHYHCQEEGEEEEPHVNCSSEGVPCVGVEGGQPQGEVEQGPDHSHNPWGEVEACLQ